jgi:hypothetical protein
MQACTPFWPLHVVVHQWAAQEPRKEDLQQLAAPARGELAGVLTVGVHHAVKHVCRLSWVCTACGERSETWAWVGPGQVACSMCRGYCGQRMW